MSHAFEDILQRRARQRVVLGRALYMLRRSSRWLIALSATALVVIVIAGIAEARGDLHASFDWPWKWLLRLGEGADRPIAPITGAALVLFCGGWLTLVGIALLRFALRFGFGPLAIARTVIDEAVRNKSVIVLLGLLLTGLAAWPYFTTSASLKVPQPLRYQIQSFLSFSSLATAALLGAVTILFAAYSVSTDINVRRTGDVFVKPLNRFLYLMGKWLGVILMMAVILGVQGVLVWGVTRLWLARNYAIDEIDQAAVYEHVLIARGETIPQPPEPFEQRALEKLATMVRDEPDLVARRGGRDVLADLIIEQRSGFMSIPYGSTKSYKFTGLGRARRSGQELEKRIAASAEVISVRLRDEVGVELRPQEVSLTTIAPYASALGIDVTAGLLQWRFKVTGINDYASATGRVDVRINGATMAAPITYIIDRVQIVDLPASLVGEDGVLLLEIANLYPDSLGRTRTMQFDTGTWIHIYHVEGGFAPNLMRASLVHLVRVAFLAMLGIITGALWSFPVAATFSFCVWLLAAGGAWLQETLTTGVTLSASVAGSQELAPVDTAFNRILLPLVRLVAAQLSRYSQLDATTLLVDGRYISYPAVVSHAFWICIVWMGLILAVGGYLFWRREIARVQV